MYNYEIIKFLRVFIYKEENKLVKVKNKFRSYNQGINSQFFDK
jgi:hypothetical protein